MEKSVINNVLLWTLIIGVIFLTFLTIKPIAIAIISSMLFGYLLKPIEKKIRKIFKNKSLSTIIIIILLIFLLIFPIVYFSPIIVKQTLKIYNEFQEVDLSGIIYKIFPSVEGGEIIYRINSYMSSFIDNNIIKIMDYFSNILVNLPALLLQIFVFIFVLFFVIRDYDLFKKYLTELSPFPNSIKNRLIYEFTSVTNAVLMGQVLVGLIQGIFMGIGFWFLGFNNVLVLTILSMILGIIPFIGPWLVWLPTGLYLLLKGDTTLALILMGYGGIFVSNIDNLIRPYFVSRSSNLPVSITLVGTIGGLMAFGIIGLILGPLILAYALVIIEAYKNKDYFTKPLKGEKNEVINKKI